MQRILYFVAMYCGLRAVFNRIRAVGLQQPQAKVLDRRQCKLEDDVFLTFRVHARYQSQMRGTERVPGMVSVSLVSPDIHPVFYRLWQFTSHFGCGHVEMAFFEEQGVVHFYAVRNIIRSNMERIGCQQLSKRLGLSNEQAEILTLTRTMQKLAEHGVPAILEPPDVCVKLAVTDSLLHPHKKSKSTRALLKKYRRIAKHIEHAE